MPINLDTDEHFLFYNGQHAVGPAGIHDVNGDDLFVCHLIHFHIRALPFITQHARKYPLRGSGEHYGVHIR